MANNKTADATNACSPGALANIGEEPLAVKYSNNKYVKTANDDGLHYTDAFYIEMYRLSHEQGMTYAQAYESLGFDTAELGQMRAAQAGYRSVRMAIITTRGRIPGSADGCRLCSMNTARHMSQAVALVKAEKIMLRTCSTVGLRLLSAWPIK